MAGTKRFVGKIFRQIRDSVSSIVPQIVLFAKYYKVRAVLVV